MFAGDAALWRDLLARARGNHNQAAQWMQQIGANVPLAARAANEIHGMSMPVNTTTQLVPLLAAVL